MEKKSSDVNTPKTFQPLAVSSKFAICGLPIRVDTYKNGEDLAYIVVKEQGEQ